MISLMLQGFLILLVAFVIGLPVGDLLARWLRRWFRRPRPETERVLALMASGPVEPPPPMTPERPPALTYPVSVFGHTTVSIPVRRDTETCSTVPSADPFI